jgi:hypothetical protein
MNEILARLWENLYARVTGPMNLRFLIALVAAWRLFTRDWQTKKDSQGLLQFIGLLISLSAVAAFSEAAASISVKH